MFRSKDQYAKSIHDISICAQKIVLYNKIIPETYQLDKLLETIKSKKSADAKKNIS